ncbi:MAG: hypothetical protein WCF51_08300, partial [Nitrosomonadaceae bacterium]
AANKGSRYWLHTLYSASRVHQEFASNKSNESSMHLMLIIAGPVAPTSIIIAVNSTSTLHLG